MAEFIIQKGLTFTINFYNNHKRISPYCHLKWMLISPVGLYGAFVNTVFNIATIDT